MQVSYFFRFNYKFLQMENGIYAKISTEKGEILIRLTHKQTPATVGNFVALAEGTMKNTAKSAGIPYYDGLTFHRVIANFMIQGGCPLGKGYGDAGYKFADEFHPDLKHDRAGVLSMANAGPNTNGSQFFITHLPTPHLDGKHSVFGFVIEGQEVVNAIKQGDKMEKIEIIRIGEEAQKWDALFHFNALNERKKKEEAEKQAKVLEKFQEIAKNMQKTASGLYYKIVKGGEGATPKKGTRVWVHYAGSFLDGRVFDASYHRGEPLEFQVGIGQVIAGWDEGILLLKEGAKAQLLIPSELAYGTRGAGGVIPPNTPLLFEVELVKVFL